MQKPARIVGVRSRSRRPIRAIRNGSGGGIRLCFLDQLARRIGVVRCQARLHFLGRQIVGRIPGIGDGPGRRRTECIGLAVYMSPRIIHIFCYIPAVVCVTCGVAVAVICEALRAGEPCWRSPVPLPWYFPRTGDQAKHVNCLLPQSVCRRNRSCSIGAEVEAECRCIGAAGVLTTHCS